MTLELSARADLLRQKTNIEQQIILCIDGIDICYGASPIFRFWKIGDEGVQIGDPGLKIGGLIADENSRAFLSLDGSSNRITQQLDIEEGGVGSISKFKIRLIDKNQEVTKLLTPGEVVDDLLGRDATVYLNFRGGAHPEDSIILFNGIIDQTNAAPGFWDITVAHPQILTNTDLFTPIQTQLTSAINNSQTTITVDDTENFLLPADILRTAVQIDDELIEYTGISGNNLTGCIRGIEGTTAASHSANDEVSTVYILEGKPIPMALKLMLSTEDGFYAENIPVTQFFRYDGATTFSDGLILFNQNIQSEQGITIGDLVTITGATEAVNNVTSQAITGIQRTSFGTVIFLGGAGIVEEIDSSAVMTIKSNYDVLPVTRGGVSAGCNMKAKQVDVSQHETLEALFAASQPDYKFIIKDSIKAKSFLVDEIYYPAGYFQVPRKGAYSVGTTIPPLVLDELSTFNEDSVKRPDQIKMERSLGKNFFNTIVYRFNENVLEEGDFLAGQVIYSQRSVNQIPTNQKTLTIDSKGLRDTPETRNFIQRQARRYNDRYQFAAESVKIETTYKDGFKVEIGDTVLFGTPALQIPDSTTANRSFVPRLMEIQQKSQDLKRGKLQFTLVDTGFGIDGRFGTISPASLIDAGSTVGRIFLKKSFGTGEFETERDKWSDFILENILVHNEDYTFSEEVQLTGFDPDSPNGLLISPNLSIAPSEDFTVDLPFYPTDGDPNTLAKMKAIHCFWDPQVDVVSGPDNFSFEVPPADINKFFVGGFVRVHNLDYTISSVQNLNDDDLEVTDVNTSTNIVTVDRDMGFTPASGQFVELIGFPDEGLPYRLL